MARAAEPIKLDSASGHRPSYRAHRKKSGVARKKKLSSAYIYMTQKRGTKVAYVGISILELLKVVNMRQNTLLCPYGADG